MCVVDIINFLIDIIPSCEDQTASGAAVAECTRKNRAIWQGVVQYYREMHRGCKDQSSPHAPGEQANLAQDPDKYPRGSGGAVGLRDTSWSPDQELLPGEEGQRYRPTGAKRPGSVLYTRGCTQQAIKPGQTPKSATVGGVLSRSRKRPFNPFTPKNDQFQISPAASPEISHHTVWRT